MAFLKNGSSTPSDTSRRSSKHWSEAYFASLREHEEQQRVVESSLDEEYEDDDSQEALDHALAESLQEKFDRSMLRERQNENDEEMRSTSTGKALHFTTLMIANHSKMMTQFIANCSDDVVIADHPAYHFSMVNVDDMVFLAERVFALQEEYARDGKDIRVDIGYHYTHTANMDRIRTDGLLSNAERQANSIHNANGLNGSIFGDGIYTGNNPFSYHNFGGGDQGLLVARLKGNVEVSRNEDNLQSSGHSHSGADTVLGRAGDTDEVCVLGSSSQCVALVQYASNLVNLRDDDSLGNETVYDYHRSIQEIVDECFNNNGGGKTEVRSYRPSQVTIRELLTAAAAHQRNITTLSPTLQEMIRYTAPESVKEVRGIFPRRTFWVNPKSNPGALVVHYQQDDEAQRAWSEKNRNHGWASRHVRYLPDKSGNRNSPNAPRFAFACGATFDIIFSSKGENGLSTSLQWRDIFDNPIILMRIRKSADTHCKKCFACRKAVGKVQGKIYVGAMPTGTMRVDKLPDLTCDGHEPGTLVISYRFDKGTQMSYHENPGLPYTSTYRVAYVPENKDGRNLLKRLKYAFTRGLTFDVGTSLTSGKSDSITWSSIPHKTTVKSGLFGFPDISYFQRANNELDALGVPAADIL